MTSQSNILMTHKIFLPTSTETHLNPTQIRKYLLEPKKGNNFKTKFKFHLNFPRNKTQNIVYKLG